MKEPKRCTKCLTEKGEDEFYRYSAPQQGKRTVCMDCDRKRCREHYYIRKEQKQAA